ncbi:hypothetical protein FOC1_g10000450, partial [Fusarium oxysporum f. sp. cubense race 1]
NSSLESIIKALNLATKAIKAVIYKVTLLRAKLYNLRDINKILSRRYRAKKTRL